MLNKTIYLVEKNFIRELEVDQVTVGLVGAKAFGLCQIPSAWSAPFFVISQTLFSDYLEAKDKDVFDSYIDNILSCIKLLGFSNNTLILRSSAVNEGMKERGQYDSIVATETELKQRLIELFKKIECIPNEGMPIIVQELVTPAFTGHMSNERRFSQESRDWKVETYYDDDSFKQDTICVRTWRKTFDIAKITTTPLLADFKTVYSELKKVAFYWYKLSNKMKCRFHLEFVFDGERIFIVQADRDFPKDNAVNPKDYNILVEKLPKEWSPNVLKRFNPNEGSRFSKLQNVKEYYDLGFCTVPLYFLDDKRILDDIKTGDICDELKEDIKTLLNIHSLVIRMDININEKKEKQLLPRSNEIYKLDEVLEWLKRESNHFTGYQDWAFIFHNFVPSIASAFVHAVPNGRIVKIQSLWGLPEGLYYNYHDTIIVDVGSKDLDQITQADVKVVVKKKYKDVFVYPRNDGCWVSCDVKEPYDWKCSIDNNSSIFDIAIKSQKLANKLRKEISVMWFVGIDKSFYGESSLPWFHEEVNISSYTADEYKRKYFKEEEKIINNSEELQQLISSGDIIKTKCFRLKPNCEKDLRNKELISAIGDIAVENDIMILLDGTQLTHSYYQLKTKGAKVVCTDKDELLYSETLEFNKLVRDKIPERIIANGENVKCSCVARPLLDRLLLEKMLEEAYEINDSETADDMLSELADIVEVCYALLELSEEAPISCMDILNNNRYYFKNVINLASLKIPLCDSCCKKVFKIGELFASVDVQRQKTLFRVEFNIQNYPIDSISLDRTINKDAITKEKKEIILVALQMLNSCKASNIIDSIHKILSHVEKLSCALGSSFKNVLDKREFKAMKAGKFKNGYILNQTVLKDNVIDQTPEFKPLQCKQINTIERDSNKYFELLEDQSNNKRRLLLRFVVPIAVNDWEISFDNSKIKELLCDIQKMEFVVHKSKSGRLSIDINAEKTKDEKQLTIFN